MFVADDIALATLMQQIAAQQAAQVAAAAAPMLTQAAPAVAAPLATEAVMPAAVQAAQSAAPAAMDLMQPAGMDQFAAAMQQSLGTPASGSTGATAAEMAMPTSPAGTPMAQAPIPAQMTQSPAPVADAAVSPVSSIDQFMAKASTKLLDALPGAALSGVGTGIQQMALANAEEEKRRAEEEAQQKLLAENEKDAQAIIAWGKNNLAPDAIEANRAEAENETLRRLMAGVGPEQELLGIKGNVSAEYLKSLAENSARNAQDARTYAGLTSKGLSWGNNKTSLSALDLARKLSDSSAARKSAGASGMNSIMGTGPNAGAMMAGSAMQAAAPAFNKL